MNNLVLMISFSLFGISYRYYLSFEIMMIKQFVTFILNFEEELQEILKNIHQYLIK